MSEVNYRRNELKFPVVVHHRMIIVANERDDAAIKACFDGFDLVEPIAEQNASTGGKYISYGVSVRLPDRATMERLDKAFASVSGLKMCL